MNQSFSNSLRRATAATLAFVLLAPASLQGKEPAATDEGAVESASQAPSSVERTNAPKPFDAEELAELEQRAEAPGPEIAGGSLTNQQLTYIVIALAAAVIVLIAK